MKEELFYLKGDFIKLGQLIKFFGFAHSGLEAKLLIQEEDVFVNGEIDKRRGKKLYPGDIVELDGKKIKIVK